MVTEFDSKGKFFTNIISKRAEAVTLQTAVHRITGAVHVRQDERILDELNREGAFVAVTGAKVYDLSGQLLYTSEFLAVNKKEIIWLLPDADLLTRESDER